MPETAVLSANRIQDRLGGVGVWLGPPMRVAPAEVERRAAEQIQELGYGSLWVGEAIGGKDALTHAAVLLAATESLVIGTGIANIWARHAATMQGGAALLTEAFPGRFVLGIGVSHPQMVAASGQDYGRPLQRMRDYLDQMDAAKAGAPATEFPRLLGALRTKMMQLGRDRADGAQPFFVPVEHTAQARSILGPDRLLVPHQAIVLEADPRRAREIARANFGLNEDPPSVYTRNLRALGYGTEDLAHGMSDRLLDAVIAWGDEAAIAARVKEHLDAGADHVLVHPLTREQGSQQPTADDVSTAVGQLGILAPALVGLKRVRQ